EADGDDVLVSLSGPTTVVEGEVAEDYTVSLTAEAQTDVTVTFTYAGEATNGQDYTGVASVVIPAGSQSVDFDIATLDDGLLENNEQFTITISGVTGGGFEGLEIDTNADDVTTTITEDTDNPDTVLASIDGPGTVVEGEETGNYTITLTEAPLTDVTVNLTYTGTATNGEDYTGVASVTILAGQTSANFTIQTTDDVYGEGTESLIVTIDSLSGGSFENLEIDDANDSVTTNISDEADPDTVTVSIDGPTTVVEGEVAEDYTVTLSAPAETDVIVQLEYSGTATDGSDYIRCHAGHYPSWAVQCRF
ncbi:calcium-binding protein, partial [Veronia nyctiphanis]